VVKCRHRRSYGHFTCTCPSRSAHRQASSALSALRQHAPDPQGVAAQKAGDRTTVAMQIMSASVHTRSGGAALQNLSASCHSGRRDVDHAPSVVALGLAARGRVRTAPSDIVRYGIGNAVAFTFGNRFGGRHRYGCAPRFALRHTPIIKVGAFMSYNGRLDERPDRNLQIKRKWPRQSLELPWDV
jgi:hypothetical protein